MSFFQEIQEITYKIIDEEKRRKSEKAAIVVNEMAIKYITFLKNSILEEAKKGNNHVIFLNRYLNSREIYYIHEFSDYLKQHPDFEGFTIECLETSYLNAKIKISWSK